MTVDVAVIGSPFLDLTFEGLERIPRVGEELIARRLHIAPGGSGMQAIGAARLGLSTALAAPMGTDASARILRDFMQREGVEVWEGSAPGSDELGAPVTALLSARGGVAMATALGGAEPEKEDVTKQPCSAAVMSLGRLHLAPPEASVYAVTGTLEIAHMKRKLTGRKRAVRALILNAAEAAALADESDPEKAGRRMTDLAETVVVTMGADGAVAVGARENAVRVDAPVIEVLDATGAGDLFVAAYVWADLRGSTLIDAVAWACMYAALSVRAPTAFAGAVRLPELLAEGRARGLSTPPGTSDFRQ
jgi:ribokinase